MTANADISVGDGERRHDPMCRPASRDVLTNRIGCDCELIARVREDERELQQNWSKVNE